MYFVSMLQVKYNDGKEKHSAFFYQIKWKQETICVINAFKKIKDTKGTLNAKMGSIKDRNGRALTEAEDIKTRWQEYTRKTVQKRSSRPR